MGAGRKLSGCRLLWLVALTICWRWVANTGPRVLVAPPDAQQREPGLEVQTSSTLNDMIECKPIFKVQLLLAGVQSVLWYYVLGLLSKFVFRPFMDKHPQREQFVDLFKGSLAAFGITETSRDWVYGEGLKLWGTGVQHLVGGLLCVPSAMGGLGLTDTMAAALARHGALCEVGWELQDSMTRAYEIVAGGEQGRKNNPASMITVLAIHHVFGICMVVPMNLYFPSLRMYHMLVMQLQFAAGATLLMRQWGFLLDMSTTRGIVMMKLNTTVVWVIVVWTRVLNYLVLVVRILRCFIQTSTTFFCFGLCASMIFGYLNLMFFVDVTGKLIKFMKVSTRDVSKETSVSRRISNRMFVAN